MNDFPHGYIGGLLFILKDVKTFVMFVLGAVVEPTDASLKKTSITKEREEKRMESSLFWKYVEWNHTKQESENHTFSVIIS